MSKEFLVIVRAGDRSLHPNWLKKQKPTFDLFVSYYGDEVDKYRAEADYYEAKKGGKWPEIARILAEHAEMIAGYRAVWFPDDDLLADAATINKMFSLFCGLDLQLAQPALTIDSYFSHAHLLQRDNSIVRYTNFVEVMAPIFSCKSLEKFGHTFSESDSGWGLDLLWPQLLNPADLKIAIVDDAAVTHTRPLGGELYKNNPELSPYKDVEKLQQTYPNLRLKKRIEEYGVLTKIKRPRSRYLAAVIGKYKEILARRRGKRYTKFAP